VGLINTSIVQSRQAKKDAKKIGVGGWEARDLTRKKSRSECRCSSRGVAIRLTLDRLSKCEDERQLHVFRATL